MRIGLTETIVVKSGSLPPAFTRFPAVNSALLTRPSISAVMREYSSSSFARSISFWLALICAASDWNANLPGVKKR
jgi:hypothetical protein